MKTIACVILSLVFISPGAFADEPTAKDIHKLAIGKWEGMRKNRQGKTIKVVKDVREDTEIVTWYNPEGEVARQGTNKYEIAIVDGVCVFKLTWEGGRSQVYAFKIHNDEWHEIHAMELGAQGRPRYHVFKRVKE